MLRAHIRTAMESDGSDPSDESPDSNIRRFYFDAFPYADS